jgi:DNA helicase-2/ATP-dependent DNA helicase PcrA
MSAVADPPVQDDPFASLNVAQRDAVEHDIALPAAQSRPLLVIAGAGSGKTSTLAHRVARLIVAGADPQRILLLTFSRRAATEMGKRAGSVLQRVLKRGAIEAPASLPWAGTFHSIGARLLRQFAGRIGLDEAFTIHDRGDSEDLMGMVRHEIGLTQTSKRFPLKGTCLSIYSRVVNSQDTLERVLQSTFPWCSEWAAELKTLFGAYVDAKQAQNVLDYDDLLLFWSEMAADPELGPELGGLFDYVLVDEYQDTNRLQASILTGMKPGGEGVMVVGDDAQSIYSFRGATVRNILDFPQQFSQSARLVTLERNYRSTQPILDASNALIAAALERHANLMDRQSLERTPATGPDSGRGRAGTLGLQPRAGAARSGHGADPAGGAVSRGQPQRGAGTRTHAAQCSFRQIWRPQVSGSGARQGCTGCVALRPESKRPHGRLPGRAAGARHRSVHRHAAAGRDE